MANARSLDFTARPTAAATVRRMRVWRAVEFGVVFFGVDGAYALARLPGDPLPALLVVGVVAIVHLRRSPGFDRANRLRSSTLRPPLPGLLAVFAVAAVLAVAVLAGFAPDMLFDMVRTRPLLWCVVVVAYPVLSVGRSGSLRAAQ